MPDRLRRSRAETDPAHGHVPTRRPVEELVRTGCLVLDKPAGPTSHQVAAWVRDIFGVTKAGHAGTLDPHVTGVLPIALADATKALAALKDQDKAYVGVIQFHDDVDAKDVEAACSRFTGEVYQRPPLRSAVRRELRTRRVDAFDVLETDGRNALVRVSCQGGTYVRKLATDVGTYLGVGAHLAALRRVRAAHLDESEAVDLLAVKDAWAEWTENEDDAWLREVVLPVEAFLSDVPSVSVRDNAVDAICHGAPLGVPGVVDVAPDVRARGAMLISTLKGEAVALAVAEMNAMQMVMEPSGVAARPTRVLMPAGTYAAPRGPTS